MNDKPKTQTERWLTWGGATLGIISIVLIVIGLFTGRPASGTSVGGTPQAGAAPVVGNLAPNFTLPDITGTNVRLSDLHGRPVILDFWYVTCAGCRLEMPALEQAYQAKEQQGAVVLGIDIADAPADARGFARQLGITYPLLFDERQHVLDAYNVTATPTSIFIDRQGVIRSINEGVLDDKTLSHNLALIGA